MVESAAAAASLFDGRVMGGFVGLVVAIGLILAGLYSFASTRRWRGRTVSTEGRVVKWDWNLSAGSRLVFEFTAEDGTRHEVVANTAKQGSRWIVGDPIRVRYDPEEPGGARIDRLSHVYRLPILVTGVGVAALLVWMSLTWGWVGGMQAGRQEAAPPPAMRMESATAGDMPTSVVRPRPTPGSPVDLEDFQRTHTFVFADDGLRAAALAPGGAWGAASGSRGGLVLLDLARGEESASPLMESLGVIYALAFSPDGARVAAGSTGQVEVFSVPAGERLFTMDVLSPLGGRTAVADVAISPSGQVLVATAGTDLVFQDLRSGERLGSVRTGEYGITRVAWSPDGSALATVSSGREIAVWPTSDLSALDDDAAVCRIQSDAPVTAITFAEGGETLVAALAPPQPGERGRLVAWDGNRCDRPTEFALGSEVVTGMAVGPSGGTVFVGGEEGVGVVRAVPLREGADAIVESTFRTDPGATTLLSSEGGERWISVSFSTDRIEVWERPAG